MNGEILVLKHEIQVSLGSDTKRTHLTSSSVLSMLHHSTASKVGVVWWREEGREGMGET